MPYQEPKKYMFRIMLPDGPHLLVHSTHLAVNTKEDVKKLHDELDRVVSSNPDAKVLYETIRQYSAHEEVEEEAAKLRAEDPDRPLATDLGIDKTNRLLTDPNIARTVAAARGIQQSSTEEA